MLRRFALLAPLAALVALSAGCEGSEERAERLRGERDEARQLARADSVAEAEAAYDPAVFDTINWESDGERLDRGAVVWQYSCRKCHGTTGMGDGETAREHDIEMPVIVAEDWEYAGDPEAIRHRIYVGHDSDMPTWGLYGLKYRDIDAVTYFIENHLRSPDRMAE